MTRHEPAARWLSLLVLLAGCTTHAQLRGTAEPLTRVSLDDVEDSSLAFQTQLASSSIESYVDFTLGVIEMSDDGHMKDVDQRAQVLSMLRAKSEVAGAILVVFVHGWHHTGAVCDGNLECFRRVLERISYLAPNDQRPVIGVYVGWRGDSCGVRPLDLATFWNRKKAARRVGEREGRDLLAELDDIYRDLNRSPRTRTTMVTVGHSFGAELVYSALETKMVGESHGVDTVLPLQTQQERAAGQKPLRVGLGDLVILVNPAVEAGRYSVFDRDLKASGSFSSRQLPILIAIASRADAAVRYAFPVGRLLRTLVDPSQWGAGAAGRVAVGHYGPQITHLLRYSGPPKPAPPYESTCVCPLIHADQTPLNSAPGSLDVSGVASVDVAEGLRLQPSTDAIAHAPYMIIETDRRVVGSHTDIFNPVLMDFVYNYVAAIGHQRYRAGAQERDHPLRD